LLIAKKQVTLYDVARLAGVSIATVSRVMHDQGRVRESTRTRVRQAIEELGFVPDGAAQSLSRRRKDMIGLVFPEFAPVSKAGQDDIENMHLLFWDELLLGVRSRLRDMAADRGDHDFSLLINFGTTDDDQGFGWLEALSGKVDGLLIGGMVPSAMIERVAARIPVVVIGGAPGEPMADVVAADNRPASAALVSHIVNDHGRRRLFHLDGLPGHPDVVERRIGLEQALRANPDGSLVGSYLGSLDVRSGAAAAERILAMHRDDFPDAVVVANDQMAIGLLRAFTKVGVRVPAEVAVVGFDDIFPASLCDPPLSTVHQPIRMLGTQACTRLFDRIARPDLPAAVEILPTELVLRSSCGCPAGTVVRRPVTEPDRQQITTTSDLRVLN
jgi:LacI family transcriptional regulator